MVSSGVGLDSSLASTYTGLNIHPPNISSSTFIFSFIFTSFPFLFSGDLRFHITLFPVVCGFLLLACCGSYSHIALYCHLFPFTFVKYLLNFSVFIFYLCSIPNSLPLFFVPLFVSCDFCDALAGWLSILGV